MSSRTECLRGIRYGIISLFVALVCVLSGCDEQIVHDLSESEANKVVSRLSAASLGAHKVQQSDGRWAIAVPEESIVASLGFLESNRVLVSRESGVKKPSSQGLVPSREEQWFRYERSMAESIEDSLGAIAGVLEARVHLNLPERDPLFGTHGKDPGSGSVLLLVGPSYATSNEDVSALVSGAAGLPPASVTVLKSLALQPDGPEKAALDVEQHRSAKQPEGGSFSREQAPGSDSPSLPGVSVGALAAVATIFSAVSLSLFMRQREKKFRFRRLDLRDGDQ